MLIDRYDDPRASISKTALAGFSLACPLPTGKNPILVPWPLIDFDWSDEVMIPKRCGLGVLIIKQSSTGMPVGECSTIFW